MGGRFGRSRIRREKRKKFDIGVYLQLRSNLLYQKFVRKTIARPASWRGRAKAKPKKSARGQKISSPKTPPFFARSLRIFYHFYPNFLK